MDYFEHYKRVNDLSERGRRSHWRPYDKTIGQFLPAAPDAVIVDVGCGAGILLEWLQARGYTHALGIDIDAGQIAFCSRLGVHAEQAADTAKWLADQRAKIDFLIIKDVLEHISIDQVRAILSAAKTALKPDGKLYIAVPNAASSFASRWRYIDITHMRSYSDVVLRMEVEQAGFTVTMERDDDTWVIGSLAGALRLVIRTVFRLIRRLEALGEFGVDGWRIPLGLNLVMVAKPADEETTGR